ncbi:MAG: hypothetical protein QM723_35055 [Myxococcaceae bacterium]
MRARAGAFALCFALGCASQKQAATVDLASEFLSTACRAPAGPEFGDAWLAYEDRHQAFYDAIYYGSADAKAERKQLAAELGPRRDEMCGHARVFLMVAPEMVAAMRARVAGLVGTAPEAQVYFSAALQWTDGRREAFEGREVLVLNARHDTFARTSGLAATVAHELLHDAQTRANHGADEQLPPLARSLYREGFAVFAVQQLFPELKDRAIGLKPEQLEAAQVAAPAAATELLRLLHTPDAGPNQRRFFQGGVVDEKFPPKMGYYLGDRVFQAIAAQRGVATAIRIGPAELLERAEAELTRISTQR